MRNLLFKAKNSSIALRIITILCSFIANIFINRSLGISLKGQYTSIYAYANFIQLAANLGLCYSYANLRRSIKPKTAKTILCTLVWMQTFILFILFILFTIYNKNISWSLLIALLLICDNQLVFLAVIDDIVFRNKILVDTSIIYVILTIISFLFANNNLNFIFICLIVRYMLEIVWISFKFHYFDFNLRIVDLTILKKVLKIGVPTAILAILISCNYNIDIFLMNILNCNDTEIGIFGVAYTLTNMLWVLPDAFKELVYNRTAKKTSEKDIVKLIIINIIICIIICLGFAVLGKLFLELFYGKEYIQAFSTTMILFVGVIPMITFKLIHPIYVNQGKSSMVVKLLLVSIISNFIVSLILIPTFQAIGAAFASVISYAVCSILFVIKFSNDFNITYEDIKNSLKEIKLLVLKR